MPHSFTTIVVSSDTVIVHTLLPTKSTILSRLSPLATPKEDLERHKSTTCSIPRLLSISLILHPIDSSQVDRMQTELDPWRDPFQRIEESEERERRTRRVTRPHQRSLSLFFNPWFLLLARLTSDSTTTSNEPNRRGSFSMNSFLWLFKTPLYDIRLTCEKKLHRIQ